MADVNPAPPSIARAYFEAIASKNVEGILALCVRCHRGRAQRFR